MNKIGVFPTMITPFLKNGEVDYEAARKITEYYIEKGCNGVFAVCQSSEMSFLSLDERVKLAKTVVSQSNGRIEVVASGHCSESIDEQIREINEISRTGIDAFITVSNRFDLHNEGDDVWIANAEKVLSGIDKSISLGIYECPMPYKRLLTPKILSWCLETKRFRFIKDTCCDPDMLEQRLKQLAGSEIRLFNANAQTLLHTLKLGGAGYSGIMANFHPELFVWLCENFDKQPEKAEKVEAFLSMYAFSECMHYPITAKYHMNLEGIKMELDSRWKSKADFTPYEKMVVEQERMLEKCVIDML